MVVYGSMYLWVEKGRQWEEWGQVVEKGRRWEEWGSQLVEMQQHQGMEGNRKSSFHLERLQKRQEKPSSGKAKLQQDPKQANKCFGFLLFSS